MKFSSKLVNNPLKQKLKEGKLCVGTWNWSFRDPFMIRLIGACGFDYVQLDQEHTPLDMGVLSDMCMIARETGVSPSVRPNHVNNLSAIGRYMDIGACGVVVPHISNAEQCQKIVNAMSYFDGGTRGFCNFMVDSAFTMNDQEGMKRSDENKILVLQFEDPDAVEKADEILSVPGVDVAIIGRGDMANAMGLRGEMNHPLVNEQCDKVIAACQRHGVAPGLLVFTPEDAKHWIDRGIRCITFATEGPLLYNTYKNALNDIRSLF